ncbi:CAP domain-containing protein [Marinilactibacillus psychrotolerans]|uniref:CAP domain-containing protein n=1 Tax=Marinilactibacillus psychrotolerans TaxID=191770 RepID=A0A5R9C8K8_9LACT|nr:CAP domain-containing protein [Marinilactibacillus psychrotolerans]TLQ09677.1 CAP domain-containing protein [Marinilactibacillus psychrotolerans]
MKVIRKLITLLLAIVFGFWLATTGILHGTIVGEWLETVVNIIPSPSEWTDFSRSTNTSLHMNTQGDLLDISKESDQSGSTSPLKTSEVDYQVVEERIFVLLNNLRQEQGLNNLKKNDILKKAADLRAKETETSFSHTRPNGKNPFTVFEENGLAYPYRVVGENLGMATYYLDEKEMAELLFNGWVESEGHYENMVRPEYEEIGIGVHYDGEFLYATQMFGTPI